MLDNSWLHNLHRAQTYKYQSGGGEKIANKDRAQIGLDLAQKALQALDGDGRAYAHFVADEHDAEHLAYLEAIGAEATLPETELDEVMLQIGSTVLWRTTIYGFKEGEEVPAGWDYTIRKISGAQA